MALRSRALPLLSLVLIAVSGAGAFGFSAGMVDRGGLGLTRQQKHCKQPHRMSPGCNGGSIASGRGICAPSLASSRGGHAGRMMMEQAGDLSRYHGGVHGASMQRHASRRRDGVELSAGGGDLEAPWDNALLKFKMRALYFGWFCVNYTDRMWEFAVPFLLLTMDSLDSMRFATIYAITSGCANIIFGPIVGYVVQKSGRRRTVSLSLVIQGIFVTLSWVIAKTALGLYRAPRLTMIRMMLALIASCTISSLATLACTLAIERDWIQCIAEGSDKLPHVRSVIRSITIVARVLAPLSMGASLCFWQPETAAGGVAACNVVTAFLLLMTLNTIYKITPNLSLPKVPRRPGTEYPFSPTITLIRYRESYTRWLRAYKAIWREYLDINGDGRIDRTEVTFGIRAGFARCWDLWAGCFAGGFLVYWIRQIVMMPYV